MEGLFGLFLFFNAIAFVRPVAVKQEETIESTLFKSPISLSVAIRKLSKSEMVMNKYRNIFYLVILPIQFLFQVCNSQINFILIKTGLFENSSILHNYINRFNWLGKKFLPEVDFFLFLRRENRTQYQQGNYPQNNNFCFHFYFHYPIRTLL